MSLAIFFTFFLSFFFLPNSYLISSLLTYLIMTKMERRKVVVHNKILDPDGSEFFITIMTYCGYFSDKSLLVRLSNKCFN